MTVDIFSLNEFRCPVCESPFPGRLRLVKLSIVETVGPPMARCDSCGAFFDLILERVEVKQDLQDFFYPLQEGMT